MQQFEGVGSAPGGMNRRVFAVLFHQDVGGAVDVEVGDHAGEITSIARCALTIWQYENLNFELKVCSQPKSAFLSWRSHV